MSLDVFKEWIKKLTTEQRLAQGIRLLKIIYHLFIEKKKTLLISYWNPFNQNWQSERNCFRVGKLINVTKITNEWGFQIVFKIKDRAIENLNIFICQRMSNAHSLKFMCPKSSSNLGYSQGKKINLIAAQQCRCFLNGLMIRIVNMAQIWTVLTWYPVHTFQG